MRYVIIRDDDTNAFTPVECLERLYRPFLDRSMPVNLATIPAVSENAHMADGSPEGFLLNKRSIAAHPVAGGSHQTSVVRDDEVLPRILNTQSLCSTGSHAPIAENRELVAYLKENRQFKIVQHGCHHDYLEFDSHDHKQIARRLDHGRECLKAAGFEPSPAFVAPYDRLSRAAMRQVAARFSVLSTGWYELRRLPYPWWPRYMLKKLRQRPHWRTNRMLLLTHPGCLLSCHRDLSTMLGTIRHHVQSHQLTVLVTHWWEYFRNGNPDDDFIGSLHETADYLASNSDVRVISFSDLATERIPLN